MEIQEHKMIPTIKLTTQKIKIFDHLRNTDNHPTAEQVYNAVRRDLPTISLATVYRNLHALAEDGDVLRLEVNKEFRFDADISPHQHGICKSCGDIFGVFHRHITEHAMENMKSEDFEPHSVRIIFHGVCRGCKGKKENPSAD